ncbi:hypothetical protein Acsp07_41010 [Actinomycetospora sp. NBRC 106378]|nr:hypothetical protein Acsp07_41010 [Actinomycetospora sp. NBRC 106378]
MAGHGTTLELEGSSVGYPKPMVALTLENDERIGQLVLWETGEAELSVIDVESEQDLLVESRDVQSLFGLQEGLDALVSAVLGQEKRFAIELPDA